MKMQKNVGVGIIEINAYICENILPTDMKRIFAAIFSIFLAISAKAQIVIDMTQYNNTVNTDVTFTVRKAGTKEGIPYASAYIIPVKDTIVTHFALSDKDGFVTLSDVPQGKVELNVEMLGYKPFRKEYSINGWEMSLGTVFLEEDAEFLDAARVTATVDPITIDKDTLIYNAAAFRVGESAMLEDLIKMMPGMAIDDDGNVTVNGEKVDKITVGGKTFFFDDPTMTLKNLPAKFVDIIKVMDKNSHEADMSGVVSQSDKEKVMDVQLKEEYRQGTFGNMKALAGASLSGEDADVLRENPGLLYSGSALVASYNEQDQLTVLGSGKNAEIPGERGAMMMILDDDEVDVMAGKSGITTSAQAGANYNTSRIKGISTNVSASYSYSSKDSKQRTARTSFLEGGNLDTGSDFEGVARDNRVVVNASMEKYGGKLEFTVRPSFTYTDGTRDSQTASSTSGPSGLVNEGLSSMSLRSKKARLNTNLYFGLRDLGKKGRNIFASGYFSTTSGKGSSTEISHTDFASEGLTDVRNLFYDRNTGTFNGTGRISYTEPFSEKLSLNATAIAYLDTYTSDKDAFNGEDGSANTYYSTYSKRKGNRYAENLKLQYSFDDDNRILIGLSTYQTQNVTESESFGARSKVGEGEWTGNWAPSIEINLSKDNVWGNVSYEGQSSVPSGESVIPAINISNPLMITAGNIYLRPSFSHNFNGQVSYRLPKKGLSAFVEGYGTIYTNSVVPASWYDSDGVRYSVNVNAKKPVSNLSGYFSFNSPIGSERLFNVSFDFNFMRWEGVSYQAAGRLDGLDKDNFSYSDMMDWFWGDVSGDRFYSGESGFSESKTISNVYNLYLALSFRKGGFYASANCSVSNRVDTYSLDPTADMDTWDIFPKLRAGYTTGNGYDFSLDGMYRIYRGYSSGMNNSNLIINASLSKTFKSVTFIVKAVDLLDRNNNYRRAVNAEYREDIIGNTLGRFFVAGISFNFGKMNAKNNSNAQNAMINMMY